MGLKIRSLQLRNNDDAITLLVASSLAFYPVTFAINEFVNRFVQSQAWWDTAICLFLYTLTIFPAIIAIVRRQNAFSIMILLFAFLSFAATSIFNPDVSEYLRDHLVKSFINCIPFLFLGVAIRDFEKLDRPLEITSRVVIVSVSLWIVLVVFGSNSGIRTAYMAISYYTLPCTLMRIYFFFRDRSKLNLLWMLAGIVCHVVWGTRGPVLFLCLFIALCVFWNNRSKYGVTWTVLLVIAGVLIYSFYTNILMSLNDLFLSVGIKNGGIIRLLTDEDLSDGRVDLVVDIIPYLNGHWIFGGGLFSDRVQLETYVHNLLLEFFCDFGVIFGIILFFSLLVLIIKKVMCNMNFMHITWAILWVSIILGFCKLFLSGSYLEEPYFFFLLGLLVNKFLVTRNKLESTFMVVN